MVKRWLTPQYDRPWPHLENFFNDSTCTWSKDDWPAQYDRPGSNLEFFFQRFNMHMVKRWLTPSPHMTDQDLTWNVFQRFNMHMVKRWLTPSIWQTRISSRIFFSKIQHEHGQKMIDLPYDRPGSHLEFFSKIQHAHDQKMIDPPYDRPGSHLEFFSKIQHAHGQKMIDLPSVTDQDLT